MFISTHKTALGSTNRSFSTTDSLVSVETVNPYLLVGNIIPGEWYRKFTNNRGAPDLSLMSILSEIVYWYRPKRIKNSNTGDITYINKFLGDTWQTSYEHFERKFGFNREKLRRIFVKLEQMGICLREFRTIKLRGQTYNNRLFIHLSSDFLNSCISNKIRVYDCENYNTKSNPSFSVPKKEGASPHFDGDYIIDTKTKNNIKKDISMDCASVEATSRSNFLENSLVLEEKENNDFLEIQSIKTIKNNTALELQSLITSSTDTNSFDIQRGGAVTRSIRYNIFTNPKTLVDFYPLNARDCSELQSLSGRDFSLNAMNEILRDMSKRLTDRVFNSRKGFLSYMSKAFAYEMRDAVKTNNETFRIKANLSSKENRTEKIENYLTQIEYSTQVSPEWHLKKKLACILEPTKAYELLKSYRSINIEGDIAKICLHKSVELSPGEIEQVLSQVKATHETFENGIYKSIQKLELIMPKEASKNTNTNQSKQLPDTLWGKIRKHLIGLYGEAIDTSWFSKLESTEDKQTKEISLRASSEFIKDWIERNYEQAIEQAAQIRGIRIRGLEC